MNGFRYCMPVELFVGENCVKENKELFPMLGKRAVIITYELPTGVRHYALEDMIELLEEKEIQYQVSMDVVENAPIASIESLADKVRAEIDPDFIIAIGGGSVIDSAKVVCLYLANPGMTIDEAIAAPNLSYLPLVAVPTTTGTGSECTCWTAVTKRDNSAKANTATPVFARYAFDDPRYVKDMPARLTRSVTLDAIAHCIESYMNKSTNPICMGHSEMGMKLFSEFKDAFLKDEYTLEDREKMLLTSSLGGMAITVARCSVPHGLSFPVCHSLNIPHGLGCAITLVPFLKRFKGYERLDRVLELCGFEDVEEMDKYFKAILKKDLGDKEIHEEEYPVWAEDCYEKQKWRFEEGTVQRFTKEDAEELYRDAFSF